jgi:NAD-dependent dihydropyrimidine dehydrogenase PreA subunit
MITINSEKCVGCGDCIEVCPQQCYTMGPHRKSLHTFAERCIGCGACSLNCTGGALSIEAVPGCFVYIIKEQLFGKQAAKDPAAAEIG